MGAYWGVLAPLVAIVITLAAMQAAAGLTGAVRSRDFRLFEDKSEDHFARQFPLPAVNGSDAEKRRKSFSPFVQRVHEAASTAQTRYHNAVVRSAGCLVLAFLSLSLGTLSPAGWPPWARSDWPFLELMLSWLDAITIISVLILYLYGRWTSGPWIAGRAGTESLRQYQILDVVFPGAIVKTPSVEIKTRFDTEADRVATLVQDGPIVCILGRIELFWSTRKASIENHTLTAADVTADALLVYLQRRARRQLGWFTDSKARLEHIAERRSVLLLQLYCGAVALALIKHVLFLHDGHSPAYLSLLLLIVTGMSAAMTAYYINQNSRSLIHRYNTQQRNITSWLNAFDARWNFVALPTLPIDPTTQNEMRAQILQFEDLMIEELVDWIHITSHDAIELAP